jgi:hypothetical protein
MDTRRDACPITAGLTSDDEVFNLIGSTLEVVEHAPSVGPSLPPSVDALE